METETTYRILRKPLKFVDLFDGSLERFGITEYCEPGKTTEDYRCLTDKKNFLWVLDKPRGCDPTFICYGDNSVTSILRAIEEVFDVKIFSDGHPYLWGYETEEEWDAEEKAFRGEVEDAHSWGHEEWDAGEQACHGEIEGVR